MNFTQSLIIFLMSVLLVVSFFCLVSCYFRWKQRKQENVDNLEEAELLERKRQSTPQEMLEEREIQMQQFRPVRKMNLARLTEDSESAQVNLSKRLLSALDSKRTGRSLLSAVPTPKSVAGGVWKDRQNEQDNVEDDKPKPHRHRFVSKWVNYTKSGIELVEKEVRTVRKTTAFRDLDWKTDIVENSQLHRYFYPTNSPHYCDLMDLLRLEEGSFKAVKVIVELDMANCSPDRQYLIRDLSQATQFEETTEEEFRRNVDVPKAQ